MATQIRIAQDDAADEVLSNDPFALLVGMLLDQQYPMEHAFRGPWKILDRFGTLAPDAIAAAEPEAFADLCATPPAIHRYGRSMAGRVQQLAAVVRDQYDGRAETIWTEADGRPRPARAAQGAARLRRPEGADLRRPGRQAARRATAPAGRRPSARTPRTAPTARWPTSSTPRRWPRCASSSRPPRPRRRPRPPP